MNIRHINSLEYRRKAGDEYETFYTFSLLDKSQIYCRRQCLYFVYEGTVYETMETLLENNTFVINVQETENEFPYQYAKKQEDLCVEIRLYSSEGKRSLVATYDCFDHMDVLGYLGNDYMVIDGIEYEVTSLETDQDRNTYVVYVTLATYQTQE